MTIAKFSLVTATKPLTLGKTFRLGAGGLEKTTAGHMLEGCVDVLEFSDVHSLVALLANVRTDQALCASLPKNGATSARIVSKKLQPKNPGALTRTKDDFGFPHGQAGVIVLDLDPPPNAPVMRREQGWAEMLSLIPPLEQSGVIWWCSASSFIHHGEQEIQGLKGQRYYLMVRDIGDTERFGEVLAKRLWLAGLGRIEISASGQKLLRSTFDSAMFQTARLDFIGGAICHPPLEQRRGAPVILSKGGWLDSRTALPDLTRGEEAAYERMIEEAKAKAEPKACIQRKIWKNARLSAEIERLTKGGATPEQAAESAERTLTAALKGMLLGDFSLELEDGSAVTVGEILDQKERYHGALTLDPLEPEYLGRKVVGKLYLFGASPRLHSFAHGGAVYHLRKQPARIYLAAGRRAEVAEEIQQRLAMEEDVFIRGGVVVVYAGGKLRAIKRAPALSFEVGKRYALCRRTEKNGDQPADLDDATANQVFAALGVG